MLNNSTGQFVCNLETKQCSNSEKGFVTSNMANESANNNSLLFILPSYWKEPVGLTAFRLFLEVSIAIIGVIGNVLVCFIMTKRPHINAALTNYIRNLAIADLGILLFNFPFAVIREQTPFRWPLGKFVCLYLYPLCEVFYGVSIWSIAAIAVERYRTTTGQSSSVGRLRSSARISSCVITGIWVASFFFIVFPLLLFMDFQPALQVCNVQWPGREILNQVAQVYVILVTMFWFLGPLFLICWTYYQISQRIDIHSTALQQRLQTQFNFSQFPNQVQRVGMRQIEKTKQILTPLVLVFVVTMLPSNVFRLMTVYVPTLSWNSYYFVLYNTFVTLTAANSASNPLIYCLVSREFRRRVITLFSNCLKVRVQPHAESPASRRSHRTVAFTSRVATFPPMETSFSFG